MRRHWGLTKEEAEAMIKAFNFVSLFQISILNEPPHYLKNHGGEGFKHFLRYQK